MVKNTQRLTFDLEIESKDKSPGIVNNIGRSIIAKKVLNLGSTELELINNSDIIDIYSDLYLSKKDRQDRILQGIQSLNGLKGRLGSKKSDGAALTLTSGETAIKKTIGTRFAIPLDFEFFNYLVCPYALKEDSYVTLQLSLPEKVILATGDMAAKYKIDISLEYDVIIDESYAQIISTNYVNMSIPYTRISNISYLSKSKKDQIWVIDINAATAQSLQGVLLLFKDIQTDFAYKNEEFYNPTFKKILITIDGYPHTRVGYYQKTFILSLNDIFIKTIQM